MMSRKATLKYLFTNFLWIGATSWGGFMALISVIQKNLVEKDKVMDDDEILDAISLASVLPGPVAFNVVAYIGYQLKGLKGAIVSMTAITLPSFVLILGLAHVYLQYESMPVINHFFKGIMPAIAAIIISVAINMAKKHIKDYKQGIISVCAIVAIICFRSFFITALIILIGAIAGYLLYNNSNKTHPNQTTPNISINWNQIIFYASVIVIVVLAMYSAPMLWPESMNSQYILQRDIFFTFSGMSVTLFGGGYVIIPSIHEVIVESLNWLNTKEFADAIAMGQITPGPIFISATFIGYKVGGMLGAITATAGIFIPPAIIMLICSRFMNAIKNSKVVNSMFKGLRPAVIGMIFAAAYTIGKDISLSWGTIFTFILALVLTLKFKINVVFVIPMTGIIGVLIFSLF